VAKKTVFLMYSDSDDDESAAVTDVDEIGKEKDIGLMFYRFLIRVVDTSKPDLNGLKDLAAQLQEVLVGRVPNGRRFINGEPPLLNEIVDVKVRIRSLRRQSGSRACRFSH